MDVYEYPLGEVLDGKKRYLIPLYQRRYSWETAHYTQLWEDIVDTARRRATSPNHTHFTGSLVLAAGLPDPGGMNTFTVVDGQQRLTTLSVLLIALRDHWAGVGDDQRRMEVEETYLTNRFQKGDAQWKLLPTQADRALYLGLLAGVHQDDPESRLDDAYRFFARQIKSLSSDGLEVADVQLAVLNGLHFVTITTRDDDNVYRIFESLNNTGLPLTQADLIRNLVFMRLGDRGEAAYDSLWQKLQDGLSPDDLVNLFWYDLLWRDPTTRRGDTFDSQKRRIVQMEPEKVEDFLRHMERVARSLRDMRDPSQVGDAAVRRLLERSARWGASAAEPLTLRLLDEGRRGTFTSEQVADALHVLEGYLVRRFLVGATASGLGDILSEAAQKVPDEADPGAFLLRFLSTGRRRFATDDQVRTAIATRNFYWSGKAAQKRTMLEWILDLHPSKESAVYEGTTIEHVLPQKLTPEWESEFAASLSSYEDLELTYESLLHTLGNLTLTAYNSELSNRPFAVKRTELQRSSLPDNHDIAAAPSWGAPEIRDRAERLADRVIAHWRGPVATEAEPTDVERKWQLLAELTAAIPPGYWASYHDVALVIGSHAIAVGQRLAKTGQEGAWRVLRWSGEVNPGFSWPADSPHYGADPLDVLKAEGLPFREDGRAEPDRKLSADRLRALVGLADELVEEEEVGPDTEDGITFTMSGERRQLTVDVVRDRLGAAQPDPVGKYWVEVDGVRWPVKQAMSLALDLPSSEFQSWFARKHLDRLGFVVGGPAEEVEDARIG